MADKPNDRVPGSAPEGDLPEPKVFFVADGKKFLRPSLETYYAKADPKRPEDPAACSCNTVTGSYCSCNKVCSCNLVCTCQSVCGCQAACSCVGYTYQGGGDSICSCNEVCTCVPVH